MPNDTKSYAIALNFEDGVTRFIDCKMGEKVLDAAFRNRVNLPMDCSDGVCGTCKCRCETGSYDLGEDFLEDALSPDEAKEGLVLTCQMVPSSDCIIAVPVPSTACKADVTDFDAQITRIVPLNDAALEVVFQAVAPATPPKFLAGQYVKIEIPGVAQSRSYSFSSQPGSNEMSFVIKRMNGGVMSRYLDQATLGERLKFSGPLGSFYLRSDDRPLLFLAGGTGLAPFLSMLSTLADRRSVQTIHLIYGVTRDADLVLLDQIEALARRLPHFTLVTCVADADSSHPRKGFVTDNLDTHHLYGGDADVYLCGPPPMVDAVRSHFVTLGISPAAFHYEKFTPTRIVTADGST